MKNNSTPNKLQELLRELDELLHTGVVTKEEYDCLNFILNHVYNETMYNQLKSELSFNSKINFN
jgi:hypothetical protein